jgi:uncharacterized protein YutE (UPF0331/DUF86 family)
MVYNILQTDLPDLEAFAEYVLVFMEREQGESD